MQGINKKTTGQPASQNLNVTRIVTGPWRFLCASVFGISRLYLRPRESGRSIYYARLRTEAGSWTVGRSTGQTVRALAEAWATAEVKRREQEAVRADQEQQAGIAFAVFAGSDFFNYDGRWALDRRASGKRLSHRQCVEKQQTFDKHVLPALGQMTLHQVNRAVLKDFRNGMFKDGYSSSTINRALDCIRAVLEAAEDEERIPAVPRIERASGKSAERGILSADEFRCIFKAPVD